MAETALIKAFKRLSQGSKQSVQSGQSLDALDKYLHVDRPIDIAVRTEMDNICRTGGGIVMLVGSAGDGKSHIISTLQDDYKNVFEFWNDGSESPWPDVEPTEALKIILSDFKDNNINSTNYKLLLAINMGMLNKFIDDAEVQQQYGEIEKCAKTLFDADNLRHVQTDRVRIVSFGNHQIFELYPEQDDVYPVDSTFIKNVLRKITSTDSTNIFYQSYLASKPIGSAYDPSYVNYQILCIPEIQDSIVKIIIEAIVRFKLMLTPRELFDFIYRIIVPESITTFNKSKDFFSTLLPSILFGGGENKILKALSQLDPLKHGCIEHNDELSHLFTSTNIPDEQEYNNLKTKLDARFFDILDEYFRNNRANVEDISKLLFRLKHLMHYHSESKEYKDYLSILCGYYSNDTERLYPLYETIKNSIPHFYGSYTDKTNIIPLDIQGRNFKMFVSCDNLEEAPDNNIPFNPDNRNQFVIEIDTCWKINSPIGLKVGYQLYEYLCSITQGKLAQANDRDHNLAFSDFISKLVRQTDYQKKITILTPDNQQLTLIRTPFSKVTLK